MYYLEMDIKFFNVVNKKIKSNLKNKKKEILYKFQKLKMKIFNEKLHINI